MKRLSVEDCKVINTYFEYLDHLNETKIIQNTHFLDDYRAEMVNMYVAACLTIKKESQPETEHPFE